MELPEAHTTMLQQLSPKLKTLQIRTPTHFDTSLTVRMLNTVLFKDYKMTAFDPEQEGVQM